MNLITPQTSKEGKKVHQVLVAEDVYYPGPSETEEFYVSVLLNRANARNMIMYSTEGGVDIETVGEKTPYLIHTLDVDPKIGLTDENATEVATNLKLSGDVTVTCLYLSRLYKAYSESDASLFEINPVLKTTDNKVLVVDAKVN